MLATIEVIIFLLTLCSWSATVAVRTPYQFSVYVCSHDLLIHPN